MIDRNIYRVPEVCKMLGISRSMFYKLVQAGKISICKLGTITMVRLEAMSAPRCTFSKSKGETYD